VLEKGSLMAGGEQIEFGHLLLAHTSGDLYVHFKNANVLAVGDVASPLKDPELDYFTGAWIGGRVDAMDLLLKLANDQTRIVPSYGPVMTKAQLKAERDVMEEVRARLWVRVREGLGPEDMLKIGVMKDLPRTWQNPSKFLYDAAKGMWGHHNKLDANVV
jgi:glyoxylase-like metal-dependent hydrolase (beta-lactamase superfamily II)